nr:hypothetical protein CFP56_44033 [Quercus suber]
MRWSIDSCSCLEADPLLSVLPESLASLSLRDDSESSSTIYKTGTSKSSDRARVFSFLRWMLERKKQVEIRKAVAFQALQSEGSLALLAKVGQKRKPLSNIGHPNKNTFDIVDHLKQVKMVQKMLKPPCHGIGKGLMTSQGPNANPPAP